jgi:hypothetical protein
MKLAICIPARDTVYTTFTQCLNNLTNRLSRDSLNFKVFFNLGSVIPQQRNELVESALNYNADLILWLDSDMHFPETVFYDLNNHKKEIVAATYSTRVKPQKNVAFVDRHNTTLRLQEKYGLHKVFAVGMGCMLIDTVVFREIPKPWFSLQWNEDSKDFSGEDIYFCKQAVDTGFEIYVDATLSNNVAHYGLKAYHLDET